MKDQRCARAVGAAGDFADNDDVVACVMGGVKITFEGRQCAVDQWHAAVGRGPRDAIEGGFRFCERGADVALVC